MKITLESTDLTVELNGVRCRVWEGVTGRGVKVHAFIPRVAVHQSEDCSEFEAELKETPAPSTLAGVYPLRMVL